MRTHFVMASLRVGVVGSYPEDDPIWQLPPEKRERKLIADAQRDLLVAADALAMIKVTERG